MRIISFLSLTVVLLTSALSAQQGIDSTLIKELRESLTIDPPSQILINAVLNNSLGKVCRNEEFLRQHNKYFSHEIKTGRITDQKSTGRCWLYAMLNTVRPAVVEKTQNSDFDFSQAYLYFWDKMEKANFFLEKAIARANLDIRDPKLRRIFANPIPDGGYWQNAVDLIKKYGCAPQESMPEVASTAKSREMLRWLNYQLRFFAYQLIDAIKHGQKLSQVQQQKKQYLKIIYRMLVFHLGKPVEQFQFRHFTSGKDGKKDKKRLSEYKSYTPKTFAAEFVSANLDDYVMFANWPARDYQRLYQWESSNNLANGTLLTFINLPMPEIKKMMRASIIDNCPVNFSADVGKQSDRKAGLLAANLYLYSQLYGVPFNTDKKINTLVGNINSTHAMVILGLDMYGDRIVKWKVENSWGSDNGAKGFFYMYDDWVDLYVVRVVIHKKYIPQNVLAIQQQKPILIPEEEPEQ